VALNLLVTLPLTVLGAIVGKSATGYPEPCRTTKLARQVTSNIAMCALKTIALICAITYCYFNLFIFSLTSLSHIFAFPCIRSSLGNTE
jgi:hypothetical protein